ncbi:MAG: PQQ-binding-like beta-propeller repeat protein [Ignavibacteriales bacterium]
MSQSISRRAPRRRPPAVLRACAALLVAAVLSSVAPFTAVLPVPSTAGAAPRSRSDGFWFAFVADSHLGSPQGNKWASSLAEDVKSFGVAAGDRPAFIVHGGDMTEFGTRDQYAMYQESLGTVGVPLHAVPGNHEAKWADVGKSSFAYALGPAFTSFDYGGVHFVLLDSSVSGETYGHLEKYMLDWLKDDLKRAGGRPVIIFSHHPIGYEPTRFIDNDDDFFDAVAPYGIAAVFTAHGHSTLRWKVNGIPFFMAPAAMDGRYMIIKVKGDAITVFDKATGSDPVEVASMFLRSSGSPVEGPSIKAQARVVGGTQDAAVEVAARLDNLAPSTPVRYRIDLGPWSDLTPPGQGSPGVHAARIDAAALLEGVHSLVVRAEAPDGGIWRARTEFTIDRAGVGRKRVLWRYTGRGGIQGSPAVTRDALLVGSNDGFVTALRRSDGRVLWRVQAGGQVLGRPLVDGRYVYFGAASGAVYCLDASTGSRKWQYMAESSVAGGVAVASGRVFVGTALGWVHCVNAASGKPVWKQALAGAIRSTPAVSGNSLFIGAWDGKVYRISQKDGEVEWSALIDASPYYAAATGKPLAEDGRLFVTSAANPRNGGYGVTALDAASGDILWRSTVPAGYSDPFVHEGLLGVTTGQGNVYLLDLATGETRRTVEGGGPCLDSCAAPGPDGAFVLGTTTGRMSVMGAGSDRLIGAVQLGDGFIFARTAISGDVAYVCTMGGSVYAVSMAR